MLRDKLKFDVDRGTVLVVVILAMIMALAFFIRVYWAVGPSIEYGYSVSGGSDSYYHERVLKYILDSKHQLLKDPMLNYPLGATNPRPPLFHWAIILGSMLFYPFMNAYDSAVLMLILFPAIWGTLTIIPLYLLGRESFNRKIGLVAAFILAVLPAHIMRSVATQADWDAFDLFLIISMFYFFLKSLKEVHYKKWVRDWFKFDSVKKGLGEFTQENKKAIIYAALAGASLGALALAWKGYTYALAILVIYLVIQIFINRLGNKSNLHIMLLASIFAVVGFGMAFPWYFGTNRLGQWFDVPLIIILAPIVLALFFELTSKYPWPFVFIVGGIGIGVTVLILNVFFTDLWLTIMSGQGYFVKSKLYSTIAEAQPASMAALSMSFGVGIFFLSIFGAFYLVYLIRKRRKEHYIFFAIYVIVAIYMAISAARFMFNASPAIALAAAIGIMWIIDKVDIKKSMDEFAKYRGSLRKSIKRNVKFSQIVAVIVLAFLVITPAIWSSVDAGIPYETKKEFDKQIYNSMPSFIRPNETTYNKSAPWYLGAFGYSLPKPQYPWPRAWKWLREQDNSSPPDKRPGFVSWWDYGFEAIKEGAHPAIADNFQNGYQIAAQIITAQNESEVISLFIARMLEADYRNNDGNLSQPVMDSLYQYAGQEKTEEILDILKDPAKYRSIIIENPQIYGLYSDDISEKNALYVAIKGTLAYLPESKIISIYDAIRNSTGWDIRYFAVDYRLFPFSGMQTGIFYAPAKLGDRRVEQYGGTVVPYDFYELKAVDSYGQEYNLDEIPRNVQIIRYKIIYKPMFYNSMLYRTFIGYSGEDIGQGDGIPGFSPSLARYQPMQGWNMSHFKLVYKTAYWNPYKDYQNHSDAWEPIPIDLALKYYHEGNGTVELNPPAYQVLPNDVVMVKFYEGAIIQGYVKLSTGEPLKNVRVTILDEYGIPHDTVLTDSNGYYKILSVAGNMTLVVSTNGELNKLRMIEKTILYQKSVNVTEEQAMRMKPDYIIKENIAIKSSNLDGVVYYDMNKNGKIDDGDVKINNGTLILRNNTYGFQLKSCIKNGSYEFKDVPPHSYTIDLVLQGKIFPYLEEVTFSAGDNMTKDLRLLPSFIKGQITYPNGTAVSNATIVLKGKFANYKRVANENGTYEILVLPDDYTIVAHRDNYYSDKIEVLVKDWNYTTYQNISLKKGYSIEGWVNYKGNPIKNAVVKIKSNLIPLKTYLTTTNNEGYFSLELPGGIYSIYVMSNLGGEKIVYLDNFVLEENIKENITLEKAWKLSGRVNSQEPIGNIGISIFKGNSFSRWFANATGYFEIYLPEGTYSIGFLGFNNSHVPFFNRAYITLRQDTYLDINLHIAESIKGYVYYDKNNNGEADDDEILSNGLIMLKDALGYYQVRNIPPKKEFLVATVLSYELDAQIYGYHIVQIYKKNNLEFIQVSPNKVLISGNIYVDNAENKVPLDIILTNENTTYKITNVTSNYSIYVTPGTYSVEIMGENITYHYSKINITAEIGDAQVRQDLYISPTAHVILVTPASEVYWFKNAHLITTGKIVDLSPGKYVVYLKNSTSASIVTLNILTNITLNIPLERAFEVDILQINYSSPLPVFIMTSVGNLTWSESEILLPEGTYTFAIEKHRIIDGFYYRFWARVTCFINNATVVTLNIIKEKMLTTLWGYLFINNNPIVGGVIHFISLNPQLPNVTVTTNYLGYYETKISPGEYIIYSSYISGETNYAYLRKVSIYHKEEILNISYERGFLISGHTFINNDIISIPLNIQTPYGDLELYSNGYYTTILPTGDYTFTASTTRVEYGLNVRYSLHHTLHLENNTVLDLRLSRNDVHKISFNIIASEDIAKPYKEIWALVKIENKGNTPEEVKFEGLSGWTVLNNKTYKISPGESEIISLKIKVPLVNAGRNEVHLRAKYYSYSDAYFNVTVKPYYNTTVDYKMTSWDGNTLIYRVIISNHGNTKLNYTLFVLNSKELKDRGWKVTTYVNSEASNYINISAGKKAYIDIKIKALKDKPSTSVPLIISINGGDETKIIHIPLKRTYISTYTIYISNPEVSNYTNFTIPMEWYVLWGLSIATFAAFLIVWRWNK